MQKLRRHANLILAIVLLVAATGLVVVGMQGLGAGPGLLAARSPTPLLPSATPEPTVTEPILPPPPTLTRLPTVIAAARTPWLPETAGAPASATAEGVAETPPAPTVPATATWTPVPTPQPRTSPTRSEPTQTLPAASLYTLRQRLGLGGGGVPMTRDLAQQLGLGWYLDWSASPDRYRSTEVEYVPMIRLRDGAYWPSGEALLAAIDAQPGALWLIGNEPDVRWQDNTPPDVYAKLYHDLYHILKTRDPACQVAIGGVAQPTPLRLKYLDRIRSAYEAQYGEPLPVDVWNVHNFVLREERDSWGVDIPPGLEENRGILREIADHDNLELFRQQIVEFRRWMKDRGQQNKPLIVSEYGILMPNDYGFPPEKVQDFMVNTFRFFERAIDPDLGLPADGYRLVQRWCWFSLADARYPTGNLVTGESGSLTPLGEAFAAYAHSAR